MHPKSSSSLQSPLFYAALTGSIRPLPTGATGLQVLSLQG
jgi:hypothetical protein